MTDAEGLTAPGQQQTTNVVINSSTPLLSLFSFLELSLHVICCEVQFFQGIPDVIIFPVTDVLQFTLPPPLPFLHFAHIWSLYVCKYRTVSHSCSQYIILRIWSMFILCIRFECAYGFFMIILQYTQPQWILKKVSIDLCSHSLANIHSAENTKISRKKHYIKLY